MTADPMQRALPREDWRWLADQLRAWPVKRVHPDRTMCDGVLRPMAADVIEAALALLTREEEVRGWQDIVSDPQAVHLNMLRGGIAKPSPANIWHLYGDKALIDAMPESAKAAIRADREGVK